jgi:hypothetical protein
MLPDEIEVLGTVSGVPLCGAWFGLTFPMPAKNAYRLLVGPASSEGKLTISQTEVLRQAKVNADLFLMDYLVMGPDWTGDIEAHVMSRSDIASVLSVYDRFAGTGVYPANLGTELTAFDAALAEYGAGTLAVEVTLQGGSGVKIRAIDRPLD